MVCTTHGQARDVLCAIKIGETYAEIHEAELDAFDEHPERPFTVGYNAIMHFAYLDGLYNRFVQLHMTYTIITITPIRPIRTAFDDIRDAMAAGDAARARTRRQT